MTRRIQNPKPLTLGEFIKSKIVDYKQTTRGNTRNDYKRDLAGISEG